MTRDPAAATRLLGAAAVILDFQRSPERTTVLDRATQRARSTLGNAAYAAAQAAGRDLAWVEVLAEVDALAATLPDPGIPTAGDRQESHGLTPRELVVLRLLAEGRSNRAIANALSLSERTVENHVFHVLAKLDLESRTAAATWAVRHGIG
jgi:DNA-binding NarL/FixJ family response regulator